MGVCHKEGEGSEYYFKVNKANKHQDHKKDDSHKTLDASSSFYDVQK